MPRLLLVDDNPSIHKIAETLLAPTSIELVCVESAPEAIARIQAGEAFEVALIDAAMAGMDGWELLAWMRNNPSTAGIPIALMAGVLDSVDPLRLEQAPIQGFLKKPVELRDLGDRIRHLLETPVPPPPAPAAAPEAPAAVPALSPFATLPAVKLKDLPEFRALANSEAAVEAPPVPELDENDLLELGEEDLLVEPLSEAPVAEGEVTGDTASDEFRLEGSDAGELPIEEEPLDLEELDLDGLKGLNLEGTSEGPEEEMLIDSGRFEAESPVGMPDTGILSETPADQGEALTVSPEDLPDLGEDEAPALLSVDQGPPPPEPSFDFDWADDSESLLTPPVLAEGDDLLSDRVEQVPAVVAPVSGAPLPSMEAAPLAHSEPTLNLEPAPLSASPEPAVLASSPQVGGSLDPAALIEALKADPVAMRLLAKALVAELGENALKELAWELMPELAERLARH